MKSQAFNLTRYDADEGMVFDWVEERTIEVEKDVFEPEHLYVKTLFIGGNDSIDNYKEVPEQEMIDWNNYLKEKEDKAEV